MNTFAHFQQLSKGLFLLMTIAFWTGSLTPQHSALLRSLRSLAPFTGSLTHSAHSLVRQLKFMDLCSHCITLHEHKRDICYHWKHALTPWTPFWTLHVYVLHFHICIWQFGNLKSAIDSAWIYDKGKYVNPFHFKFPAYLFDQNSEKRAVNKNSPSIELRVGIWSASG